MRTPLNPEAWTPNQETESVDASSFAEVFAGSSCPKVKVSPWGVLLGPGGCRCCVSGPGAFFVVVPFSLLRLGFFLASSFCFKRKGGDPGTDQLFFEDPADWHRPENQNSFRYPQRLRRPSTAKCSLKVSSWPVPVHRAGSGHRESGCLLRDGCCGWRPPDSGAA